MNQDLRSILTGTAALTVGAVVSLVLTIRRQPQGVGREQTVRVFLLRAGGAVPFGVLLRVRLWDSPGGVLAEEFSTSHYERLGTPQLLAIAGVF
jgi:hypothetical protein